MKAIFGFLLASFLLTAQEHPLRDLVEAARKDSPVLRDLLGKGLPELESKTPATVSILQ